MCILLTVKSPVVTLCTTCCSKKTLHFFTYFVDVRTSYNS